MPARPYQSKLKQDIYAAWVYARFILAVLATRGGKTYVFAEILKEHNGMSVAIAHRQELIGQISLALARFQVPHRIIAPQKVVKFIVQLHVAQTGKSYYDPNARVAVAGVDTLMSKSRQIALKPWAEQITLWVQDEAHHVLKDNKWGRAAAMFPNAKGLGVTANTFRADGKGLGEHADGIMDVLVESLGLADLIAQGYATPYRIFSPTARDLNLSDVGVSSSTGDFNQKQLVKATGKSSVIGDVVEHYKKLANGKLGITFAPGVEIAADIAAQFNAAGVPAEVVSAKTPDRIRIAIQERFKRREIWQLVNVDLFGEGYDVPGIEVVSMARATESFNLFCQQFARGLTLKEGKETAIIIDHVGNCIRFSQKYGMPDSRITWSLDRREKRSRGKKDPDLIPTRSCPACTSLYEAIYRACPYCGHVYVPAIRSAPEFVDGDLYELDAKTLAAMRGEVGRVDTPVEAFKAQLERGGLQGVALLGAGKQHSLRQEAQVELRASIAQWAGYRRAEERPDSESYRRFFFKFGIDVLSAKALGRPEAEELRERIEKEMTRG